MPFNLANQAIKVLCPNCQKKNEIFLRQAKNGEAITCRWCGEKIRLVDDNNGIKEIERNINKALGSLSKNININLRF